MLSESFFQVAFFIPENVKEVKLKCFLNSGMIKDIVSLSRDAFQWMR